MAGELIPGAGMPPPDLSSICLAITEHSPLPMATVEGATHIVRYGNPAFCRLMQQPLESLVGKPFDELLPEKDQCVTLLDRVFRTGKPASYTEQESSKPHPVFWSYTIWPVLEDEGLVGVMIQVTETAKFHGETVAMNEALVLGSLRQHELTEAAENLNAQLRTEMVERNRAEEALRESEERFRSLFASAPMAIFVCDRNAVIENYNRLAVELWGREPALGVERHCGSVRLWLPDGMLLPHDQSPMVEVLRTGLSTLNVELFIERPDGSRLPVLVNIAALKDAQGETTGTITSFMDITDRRMMEDELAARATELARADRSKNEFLAMLAHELRNPLAPLRHAAEILQTPAASAQDRADALRILGRQTANMSRMIDDLLDVSRITEGKIELRLAPVALEAILTSATSLARSVFAASHQELTVSMPLEPLFLNADATRLEQVFNNLLGNASKYSGDGHHIWLSAERAVGLEGPEVLVRVRDDGVGIAPELLPHVFDLFVQASRSLDRAHGGLGIGLTLVSRLVKLHGGRVEAHSDGLGHGSEFIVRLPIIRHAPTPLPPPVAVPPEDPRRILVVDDNTDSALSMGMLQRRRGHEVRTAFTGPDAVTTAAEFLPEVVILDIGLPGMDGFEVARRLRAMPALAGVFIVAMSGYGSDEDRATAKQAGFDEFLVKPANLDLLSEWLRGRA